MIPYRVITVENRSSCPNKEFHKAVWATSYQLIYQFGRSPWAETARGYLQLLSPGQKPPKGAAHLIVLDHSTEAGTLGFHEDEHNNEIPYADVFYKTSEEDGVAVSEVISHECLAGDTKIPLLDGTETTIKDMVGKKPQWVYSCNDQGEVKPGLAHSARITRHNAPVLKITLDNGESITCTSNHRFLLHNKTYLEASKLSVGQSLMPLYRDRKVIEPEKKRKGMYDYECILQPWRGEWEWTHRVVLPECPANHTRHHKDFNRFNNSPENLELLTWKDHAELHSKQAIANNKNKKGVKLNLSSDRRAQLGEIGRKNLSLYNGSQKQKEDTQRYYESDPNRRKAVTERLKPYVTSEKNKNHLRQLVSSPKFKKRSSERITKYNESTEAIERKKEIWNHPKRKIFKTEMSKYSVHLRLHINGVSKKISDEQEEDIFYERLYDKIPISIIAQKYGVSSTIIYRILNLERNNKEDCIWCLNNDEPAPKWKEPELINHKVISIEPAGTMDVYDITVDEYHNFATSAGVFVHNCLELIVDPFVASEATTKFVTHENKEYILEICDAVEGNGKYDLGAPYGVTTGVVVSDFVYPAWFGLPQEKLPNGVISKLMSFRNTVRHPFELCPEGYMSYKENGEWRQEFGVKRGKLPAWASRLPRIKQ